MAKHTRGTRPSSPTGAAHSGIGRFAREQPLLMSAFCIGVGIFLGCMLRMTPEESEFFEEQADRLKEHAGKWKETVSGLASDGYDKARNFAERTMDRAGEAVKGAADTVNSVAPEAKNFQSENELP